MKNSPITNGFHTFVSSDLYIISIPLLPYRKNFREILSFRFKFDDLQYFLFHIQALCTVFIEPTAIINPFFLIVILFSIWEYIFELNHFPYLKGNVYITIVGIIIV